MYSGSKKTQSSPRSPRGVNFYQQFTRSFIRPYGVADTAPTAEKVFPRLKPFTCEWLVRPKVALSEFAETVQKNLGLLMQDETGLIPREVVQLLTTEITPLLEPLSRLTKDNDMQPTRQSVLDTMRFLYKENPRLDEAIDTMFEMGGAMFTLACQYIVARSLIRNPASYGELVQAGDGTDSAFQKAKDINTMRDFIVDSVVNHPTAYRPTSNERRNLISAFDDVQSTGQSTSRSSPRPQQSASPPVNCRTASAFSFLSSNCAQGSILEENDERPFPTLLATELPIAPTRETSHTFSTTSEICRDVNDSHEQIQLSESETNSDDPTRTPATPTVTNIDENSTTVDGEVSSSNERRKKKNKRRHEEHQTKTKKSKKTKNLKDN